MLGYQTRLVSYYIEMSSKAKTNACEPVKRHLNKQTNKHVPLKYDNIQKSMDRQLYQIENKQTKKEKGKISLLTQVVFCSFC